MSMGRSVGKVDHVVMMVWPENLEAACARVSELLGVEFEFFDVPIQGVKGALDTEAMVEFIAPRKDGSASSRSLERLLAEKGEGLHSITFGVADAHATDRRLKNQGFKTRGVFNALNEDTPAFMRERFSTMLECPMKERIAGSLFVLSQIERREPEPS
jgi:4-hydroxyphenylpyruvate dioxygenase-like putative hemolysin